MKKQIDLTTDLTKRKIADDLRRAIQAGDDASAERLLADWDALTADDSAQEPSQ